MGLTLIGTQPDIQDYLTHTHMDTAKTNGQTHSADRLSEDQIAAYNSEGFPTDSLIRNPYNSSELHPAIRRYKPGNKSARRQRHSAPDITFGGKLVPEILRAYQQMNTTPLIPPERRKSSSGSELEEIKEEDDEDKHLEIPQCGEDNSQPHTDTEITNCTSYNRSSLTSLPPIYENQDLKLDENQQLTNNGQGRDQASISNMNEPNHRHTQRRHPLLRKLSI